MRSVVFAVLLAVSLSFPCLAQRDTNISTRATLTVYVAFTNERALGKSIEVRVYQRGQILFGESFTDERGRARFDQVPAGYYHIEVQGTGIEKTEGPEFEILDMEGAHTETVRAKPTADATAGGSSSATGTGATVSATELKIPEKAQKEFDKGVDAFAAGDNKKAEESFNKAIEEYPKYANAYTVDNKFVPGYVNLARLSFAAHSYPETENTINKALAISPDNLDALALLATTEYMNKENEKALANVRHIHSLPGHEPFSGVHLLAAQILMEENERDQAIDQYIAFLQESPNDLRVPAVRKTVAQMKGTQH
jgi:tetratricopeptide (TPR) repeat protein